MTLIAALQDKLPPLREALPTYKTPALIGVAAAAFLCGILFLWLGLNSAAIKESLNTQLSQDQIAITYPKPSIPERIAMDQSHGMAHEGTQAITKAGLDASALPPAPIESLSDPQEIGILPKRSAAGMIPYDAYKKPVDFKGLKPPYLAIGLSGYGLSESLSTEILTQVPNHVTLLMSAYTPHAQDWVDTARQHGFETWLSIPFESQDYPLVDTGAMTILNRSSLKLNLDRTDWAMSRATGYTGLYGYRDETFAQSHKMSKALFEHIFARGVGYLELFNGEDSVAESAALQQNTPYIKANKVFAYANAAASLNALADIARQTNLAIGVIEASPIVVENLPGWIKTLKDSGITLVPISAIDDFRWSGQQHSAGASAHD